MTTEQELQELSKRAAGCLPSIFQIANDHEGDAWVCGYCQVKDIYNHTSLCTEIMVRVLWPAGWTIDGADCTDADWPHWLAWTIEDGGGNFDSAVEVRDPDPMLAFRVAVLRALCALKP